MRLPWKRIREAKAQSEKAKTEYEWAVQNRTIVSSLVTKLQYHGERNSIVENLEIVARGGHK